MRHLGDAIEGFFLFKERVFGRDCLKLRALWHIITGGVYLDSPREKTENLLKK